MGRDEGDDDGDVDGHDSSPFVVAWQVLCIDIVCPPAPLHSTSASNIAAAICKHPLVVQLEKQLRRLKAAAGISASVSECDGAAGNDRLHYAISGDSDERVKLT
jgi:hypothetical protein